MVVSGRVNSSFHQFSLSSVSLPLLWKKKKNAPATPANSVQKFLMVLPTLDRAWMLIEARAA